MGNISAWESQFWSIFYNKLDIYGIICASCISETKIRIIKVTLITAITNITDSSSPWSLLSSPNKLSPQPVFSRFVLLLTIFRLFIFLLLALLGVCDQNHANDFMLRDGTVTANSEAFIREWTVKEMGKVCEIQREDDECSERAISHCHLLLSDQFSACHRIIPPDMFYDACEESSCYEEEACEMITSYAHICRENGICIDWRTPEFCRKGFSIY